MDRSCDYTPGNPEKAALAERIIGHRFADQALLMRALTHPSAAQTREANCFYERLEFLGDSVVGFVIAEETFRRFPEMSEGGMTRIRISLVNGAVMSAVAGELGLADALVLGESERHTSSRGLVSALENAFEALTAALYLDAGMDAAREWVLRTLGPRLDERVAVTPENPKSLLQEIVQARGSSPAYRLDSADGPPHDRTFHITVLVDDSVLGEGSGRSKKEAEAAAAAQALVALEQRERRPLR